MSLGDWADISQPHRRHTSLQLPHLHSSVCPLNRKDWLCSILICQAQCGVSAGDINAEWVLPWHGHIACKNTFGDTFLVVFDNVTRIINWTKWHYLLSGCTETKGLSAVFEMCKYIQQTWIISCLLISDISSSQQARQDSFHVDMKICNAQCRKTFLAMSPHANCTLVPGTRGPHAAGMIMWSLVLLTIHWFYNRFSQSRIRPLLGPSPGCKCLLALSHLRHY